MFKRRDIVKIKPWNEACKVVSFCEDMKCFCGKVAVVERIRDGWYKLSPLKAEDNCLEWEDWYFNDDMVEVCYE